MSKRWVVVDTNIFCFTGYQTAGVEDARACDYLHKGGGASEFLHRVVEYCDEYGLAVDSGGLIVEEYDQKIPRGSFGYWAFRQLTTRIPDKVRSFRPKNPDWVDQLEDSHELDKHDRRFLATALATPDKILVSEDTVFLKNTSPLRKKGVRVYAVEDASDAL
jgi:hypothetical protein